MFFLRPLRGTADALADGVELEEGRDAVATELARGRRRGVANDEAEVEALWLWEKRGVGRGRDFDGDDIGRVSANASRAPEREVDANLI